MNRADRARGLVAFVLLTLAATWACFVPVILSARGVWSVRADDQALLRLLGVCAPPWWRSRWRRHRRAVRPGPVVEVGL